MSTAVRAPDGLRARGRAFWTSTVERYDLSTSEVELLKEVCRSIDEAEQLAAAVAKQGATVKGSKGQTRTHPALGELRQTRATLQRLLAQLALPKPPSRPHDETLPSLAQARSRRANDARWAGTRRGDPPTG